MAYTVADRVKETTVVTGTGPATLLGAASGYRSFGSQLSIGDTCAYAIVNANASEWEVGIGTYSAANTLTRTTVHASTNANAAVVFTAGTKDVFLSPTAETVLSDVTSTDGTVTLTKTGSIVDLSVAVAAATTNVIVQVRNTTGATLTKGTVVYINNAIGQIPTVAKALATSDATSAQTLGMISADINDNANGYVTIIGLINDISLDTGIYNDGDQLYLSGTTAGSFTKVKPYAPTHLVYVGIVEHAHNVHGKIFVKVQNGYELDELHDVSAQNPTNGQTIVYNSTTDLWEKNTVSLTAGVNGVLPVANGGTGVTTSTGSGNNVLSNAPTLTTATFAAGTISASTPNTITQTWNNAAVTFTGLNINVTNTASATGSFLSRMQVNGVDKFAILTNNSGYSTLIWMDVTNPRLGLQQSVILGNHAAADTYISLASNKAIGWADNTSLFATGNMDVKLYRDAAGTLAQRNGTNAQSFRVYNTYTDASNYERLGITWAANVCNIAVEKAGTGTQRRLGIGTSGSIVNLNSSVEFQSSSQSVTWYTGDYFGISSNELVAAPASGVTSNRFAQRNGTNPQSFRVYNTWTDANNYERLAATWASNVCTIGLEQAGTGSTRNLVVAGANATTGAGGNVTISAGNGSGVGAGGNIILQPGAQGTSGGNGKIRINDTAGVDTGFNFTRGYAGYPTLDQNRVYLRSATDNNQVIEFRSDAGAGNINIGPTGSVLSLGNGSNYVGLKEKSNSGTVSVISGSYTGTTGSSFAFPNATTAIAANTNDLALPASAFQRLNCTTACSLTGIAPVTGTGSVHVDGRMIRVYNVGTANLTLSHNSVSSTATNRFFNATGADIVLSTHQYVELIYDSTDNGRGGAGWRVSSVH